METADKYCCRTLPMRNWYNICREKAFPKKTLSDITYEELIHISPCKPRSIFFLSSDITYEELIHSGRRASLPIHEVGHYLWGIDTFSSCSILSWISRRTLPMRNWYRLATILIKILHEKNLVGHYLWGIDTFLLRCYFSIARTRRTLPMRNWYMWKHQKSESFSLI